MDQDSPSRQTEPSSDTSDIQNVRKPFVAALEPIGDMLVLEHEALGETHYHYFPMDWKFGGADECDPRADPRWPQTTYVYYDSAIKKLWTSQTPLCDEEALDNCSAIRTYGPRFDPWLVKKQRPGEEDEWLPWKYNATTDELIPWV